jgi:polyisoprenoid-binding protein YceI
VLPSLKSLAFVLLTVPVVAPAQSVTWTIDPDHSVATFTVRHMLVANVRGEFAGPTGTVSYDPSNIAGTLKVETTIDARTINTRNTDRDKDLKGDQFFAVAKYPTITFKSKRALAGAGGHWNVTGDLVMRGVTKEVVLDVEGPTPAVKDLLGQTRVGATMTTVLSRRAFGLLYNELLEAGGAVVGDEVRVTIDVEVFHKEKE